MGKISKSDQPIDRRPIEERMKDFFKSPPCEHFAVGTKVKIAHLQPLTVVSVDDGVLTCQYDDGSVFIVRPYALNRSK